MRPREPANTVPAKLTGCYMARPKKIEQTIKELTPELYPLEKLRPDPLNPNQHSATQVRDLARSMKRFGVRTPILARSDDTIVVGHGRREAALKAGLKLFPVIRLPEGWTDEEARAYMIADNQHARNSTWDVAILGKTLAAIGIGPDSPDLPDIGFSEKGLSEMLGGGINAGGFLAGFSGVQAGAGATFERRGDNLVEVKFALTKEEREEVIWRLATFRESEKLDKTSDALVRAIRKATEGSKRNDKL